MSDASEVAIDASDLPPLVAEIQRLIGTSATLALVHAFGGQSLYFPDHFDPQHPIVPFVGHAAAASLMQHFARERIYLAKCDGALRVQRNIAIARRVEAGVPVRHLAAEYGLSERRIWSILKRPETLRPSAQRQLFGDD